MITETVAAASLARLVQPLIKDLYNGAKKLGIKGLARWESKGFAAKLGRRIGSIEAVRTLWKPEGSISLREFFHPPKLKINDKPTPISRLAALPANAVIIEGIVGQGKSVFLRSLASEEIRSNDAKRLPIFLELKDLNAKMDLRQSIHRQLETYDIDIDDDTLEYLFKSGRTSLLLDGFDEVEDALVKATFMEIEQLSLRYPDLQIVVSSRPGHEIQKSTNFRILRIADLTTAEYPAFLIKLQVSADKSVAIRQAIKSSPSKISSLITTPLMLTLVVIVYESESQIPETLPEFFERLFQVVFSRHDHLKAAFTRKHHSGLSERRLQKLFEAFCFMTLQLGYGRVLSELQFNEVFDAAREYADGCECEVDKFKLDITRVACLMLEDGIDSITFLHKSILEYYASAFVKSLGDENAKLFYAAVAKNSVGWEEVLMFLKSIDSLRYSRNYVIPVIANERSEVIANAPALNDAELTRLVSKLYPGSGLYFRADDQSPTNVRLTAYAGSKNRPGDHLGDLNWLMLRSLGEIIPNPFSASDLQEFFGVEVGRTTHEIGTLVPAKALLRKYGTDALRKAIEIYAQRLVLLEDAANSVIKREEKRTLIFERKVKE